MYFLDNCYICCYVHKICICICVVDRLYVFQIPLVHQPVILHCSVITISDFTFILCVEYLLKHPLLIQCLHSVQLNVLFSPDLTLCVRLERREQVSRLHDIHCI